MGITDYITIDVELTHTPVIYPFVPDSIVRYCESASALGMKFDEWAAQHGLVEIDLYEGDE